MKKAVVCHQCPYETNKTYKLRTKNGEKRDKDQSHHVTDGNFSSSFDLKSTTLKTSIFIFQIS